jgi:DNA polymerase-3 subunit epsilon/ATP-dependent DNA helicase DinG
MPTTYVAVDVETTGLNPDYDAIIEVGAVVFDRDGILEEFDSLVYPGRDIPAEITALTGITDEMVAHAPDLGSLRSSLRRLVGDHVVVGHNVAFDLAFLRAAYVGQNNQRVDTVTLASIMLPRLGRYSLGRVAAHLSLPVPDVGKDAGHRALGDARRTAQLFLALLSSAEAMSLSRLNEIVKSGRRLGWPETAFFEEALSTAAVDAFRRGASLGLETLYDPPPVNGRLLAGVEDEPRPIDADAIAGMLEPGSHFSRAFPDYEYREQQVTMVRRVAEAFNRGEHLFVEAGTGTGKSVAYLLPAAFWADLNDRPVVISTNTINLQDQLVNKDIPQLQRLLVFEVRAAVLKGKRNYLCTRLFEQMRHRGPSNAAEMTLYARILNWLPDSETGDLAEITLRGPDERLAWSRLSADNDGCKREICAQQRCPLHVSRARASRAHLIIVNHSLLLADVAAGSTIIPDYKDLVVDEAHHMEAAITDSLTFMADQRFTETLLDEINRPRAGLLGQAQSAVRAAVPPDMSGTLDAACDRLREQGALASTYLADFFDTVAFFMRDHVNARSQYSQSLRVTPATRTQPYWDEIEIAWDNLRKPMKSLADGLQSVAANLEQLSDRFDIADVEDLQVGLAHLARDLAEIHTQLEAIIFSPSDAWIYWIEAWRDRLSLHAAPLEVGPLFQEHIFNMKDAVVLTSATLRTANPGGDSGPQFDYIRARLNGGHASELAVGSPFDYQASTLIYLPTDIPEPNQPGYQRYVEQAIVDVAGALGGRTMALFTSYSQLAQTAKGIEEPLRRAGVSVLAQLEGASRQQILEQFKAPDARAVLLGTRSFWEGVDVPGEALQAVFLVKLPFDVPSDPVFAARSETFDSPFFEYSIPEAVLRFRQGFGRLIRRQDDEGIVIVLDKRVLTKRYGQLFLDALPDCTIVRQRAGRLAELAERWFARDR